MRNRHANLRGVFLWGGVLAFVLIGCAMDQGVRTSAPAGGGADACVLVDTDVALDDFRAIAALIRTVRVVGVVTTEGISTPERGAMAVAHLLAAADTEQPIPILVGAASPEPSKESWLPEVRANAERLNGFLAAAIPMPGRPQVLADEVERLVAPCRDVRVLVLGPWTSFIRYQPRLAGKLRQVVTQGLPLADVPADKSPGFNCRYDLAACRQINETLRPTGLAVWVDVPRNVTPPYAPTPEMIEQLVQKGLPGTIRALLLTNRDAWKDAMMWDDSAALYLLRPDRFGPQGAHQEPVVPPAEIRDLWLNATNRLN